MSNVFSGQMEQDYYDELFMQDTAKIIDAELLDDLKASQELEIDEKWLQDLKQHTTKRLGFKKNFRRVIHWTKRIGRIAAIFFLTVCILFGGIYDDRLLLKPTEKVKEIIQDAEYSIPYDGAKPMILCDFIDDGERLSNVIKSILSKNG